MSGSFFIVTLRWLVGLSSMITAVSDLELDRLFVVHRGEKRFEMKDRIEGVGIEKLPELCFELRGA